MAIEALTMQKMEKQDQFFLVKNEGVYKIKWSYFYDYQGFKG